MSDADPDLNNGSNQFSAYAGRWVAWLKGRVVGQGGTPDQALQAAKSTRHKEIPQVSFVNTTSPLSFSPLFDKVKDVLPKRQSIYLVGGAVRDAILNKTSHDLDFALLKDAQKTARKVANALQGAYYRLDDEHEAGRVVLTDEAGTRQIIDFAVFRGPDLEADLRGRDFTINALAVEVNNPQELLDPLGGINDLYHKQIRPCSKTTFSDDPLRTLRAVRFAAKLKFKILAECKIGIREAVVKLPEISAERIRDELFKILEAPQPTTSIRVLDILGILPYVLPEIETMKGVLQSPPHIHDVWEHSLQAVKQIERICNQLDSLYRHDNEEGGDLATGLIAQRLGRYREQFTEHINTELTVDRNYRPILILAALYHDIGKSTTAKEVDGQIKFIGHEEISVDLALRRAKALHLSNAETQRLITIIQHHSRPNALKKNPDPPTLREIYRYFRDTGEAGISIALLSLADLLAIHRQSLNHKDLENLLEVLRVLLEAYWENYDVQISPPALVNGRDLMKTFDLPAGPMIGDLIEAIREGQAVGEIKDEETAMAFAERQIREKE